MTGPSLTIPEETMRALIGNAILTAIDQEARDALIQSAINYLVAPSKISNGYRDSTGPSPLEQAFTRAVEQYANGYVKEWMTSNDDMNTAMRNQLDKLFGDYRVKLDEDHEFRSELNAWVIDYLSKPKDRY
jgi:hypothetical protein